VLAGLAAIVTLIVAAANAVSARPRHHNAASPPSARTSASKSAATTWPGSLTTVPPPYFPPAVAPRISPALPGEGQWSLVDAWDRGPPAILTTTFRPFPAQSSTTAYVAWIRTSSAQLALYPGYKGPGPTSADRGPEMVPLAARSDLLATFNSGFYEADAAGGFYTHATLYAPMIDGLATVVAYTNGKVDIVDWSGGPQPGPDVVMARQNLTLMVDGGGPTPALQTPSRWGITLGGVPAVWRTGLGVDSHGNLIYVAAPAQTAATLAQIMIDVGSVRAMQLDINPEWPIFVTYAGPGALNPSLFVPNPNQIPNRFLYSSTKDFFAVYVRSLVAEGPPWYRRDTPR
jgi:hypothetical protein